MLFSPPARRTKHARTESLAYQLKDLFRSLKPFGNLSPRMLPAGPALGNFGGLSSDDRANDFDSKIAGSIWLQGLAAAYLVCSATFLNVAIVYSTQGLEKQV
jgi:hypothetical protein